MARHIPFAAHPTKHIQIIRTNALTDNLMQIMKRLRKIYSLYDLHRNTSADYYCMTTHVCGWMRHPVILGQNEVHLCRALTRELGANKTPKLACYTTETKQTKT
jgi:hypothetical protein